MRSNEESGDDMIVIKTYDQAFLTQMDFAKLNDEGVECFLKDENIVSVNPILSNAVGGIKLLIHRSDFEKAAIILDKNEYDDLKKAFDEQIESQLICPKCGSVKVRRKNSVWASLFFGIPLATTLHRYLCLSCKYIWDIK